MLYFTADWHWNHLNIIKYCNRPFINVDEMNATLVKNYNEKVNDGDTCYFLGDTCFSIEQFDTIIPQLNGKKSFLEGNHDKWWNDRMKTKYKDVLFIPKEQMLASKKNSNMAILLNHYPMRSWADSHYGTWHLYGHVHGKMSDYGYSTDVGVDATNFYPVSLDELVAKFANVDKENTPYKIYEYKYNIFNIDHN